MSDLTPTPEQAAAISAPLQPQLLVAGAGAGKTTVMARRIFHLVQDGLARPDQVLGLTFTNKAAQHLKEQVRVVLGSNTDVTVATYHSYGASLVADHGLELDLAPGTQVLNRAQSWQLLFAVFDEFRFEKRATFSPEFLLNDALNLASRCADHLVPVEAVIADCARLQVRPRWKKLGDTAAMRAELCQVVAAYERRKRERNLLDFGDQVALAVRLLTEHPAVAAAERDRHPVVLLDEYQDTNFAQRRLLQLIYPPGSAVTAVGDDMQSIYGFRGAHLANILRFTEHFPPVTTRPLQTTFRFGPDLVTLANGIQANVTEALDKELAARPGAPPTRIECFLAGDDLEEAATVAADVAGRGAPYGSTAILCRKRRLIRPIVTALEDRGIPVEVLGASGLLDRPEVVDVVAWLEVLADASASVALVRILEGPRYRIGRRDLAALARHCRTLESEGDGRPLPLVAALGDLAAVPDLSAGARTRLGVFCSERAELAAAAGRLPVLDLAETVILRTGLWRAAGDRGRENLLRFLDLAERFEPVEGDPGLAAFVEYLQLLDESEEDLAESHPGDTDAVKVMTVHQAKGLEFDVVHVPGLAGRGPSKIFPDGRAGENAISNSSALPWWLREDDEGIPSPETATMAEIDAVIKARKLDEEWRLLYVACTRARRLLVCSAAHWYRGAAEPQGPSPFYDFVAGRSEVVERFRHPPAGVDPAVTAKERQQADIRARYAAAVAPRPVKEAEQLRLDAVTAEAPVAVRRAPSTLSVTGLVSYARCPRQFFWTVVRPLPRRSSAAARIGSEVHRWIELRAGRQLTLVPPDAEGEPGETGGSGDIGWPAGEAGEAPVTVLLQRSFLASPWAALDPVRVEAPFALALDGYLVRGRIDAVYERDERLELVDFKTGREPEPGDAGAGTQLDVYGLAALDTWGIDPARLRTTYCYLRADGPPEVVSSDWDASVAGAVRARLAATLDRLSGGAFGTTPGGWCRGCDFVSVCPAGRAHVEATIADPD